jgi:CheY-like chemotaxis protein
MKTVLIVGDERPIAEMLGRMLEDEGYRVLTARDGREGLACLAHERPDVVLCDVMMPVLDGGDMGRARPRQPGLSDHSGRADERGLPGDGPTPRLSASRFPSTTCCRRSWRWPT